MLSPKVPPILYLKDALNLLMLKENLPPLLMTTQILLITNLINLLKLLLELYCLPIDKLKDVMKMKTFKTLLIN